jgi:arsenate reductase
MSDKVYNVLFICTGNSARSIIAEGLMNHLGGGRFKAWSAGSHPKGDVNPLAQKTLAAWRIPSDGFRSKSWEEFAGPGAPALDFVFTVCDNAAGEVCPVWPGQPMSAHWGVPDPAAVEGSEEQKAKAFMDVAITLKRRIELMLALPLSTLAGLSLQRQIERIGLRQADEAAINVLILCTHNSARSMLAEGMLNALAARRGQAVRAYSAGSQPSGRINPFALDALRNAGIETSGLRSKSWDEFSHADAPPLSVVITVCDSAAAETCPVFFGGPGGRPLKTHWGYPDPSNAEGGDEGKRRAFELTRQAIGFRMLQLLDLLDFPDVRKTADRQALQAVLDNIGKS